MNTAHLTGIVALQGVLAGRTACLKSPALADCPPGLSALLGNLIAATIGVMRSGVAGRRCPHFFLNPTAPPFGIAARNMLFGL